MKKKAPKKAPNPGSDEAYEQGCICARIDNGYGKGAFGGLEVCGRELFYITVSCPLHGKKEGK